MENTKIFVDNGNLVDVNGIFYVFNSKYYFIYTMKELDENDYVRLYVVQVCKEIQNTPTGPIDTGYMLGMEISNSEEWVKVQESIAKIVEDKKNNIKNSEIQYLPMNMLNNLKIISKNKFKLIRTIIEDNFKVSIVSSVQNNDTNTELENVSIIETEKSLPNSVDVLSSVPLEKINEIPISQSQNASDSSVIIDYRSKFFEEQEKNQELEEQLKLLTEKLNNIKNIIG